MADYRQALAARPGDAALLDNLGSALLMQGKTEEAIACYREALVHAPDFAEAHFHLGAVLSQNGHVAEGFEHYMRRAALVYGREQAPTCKAAIRRTRSSTTRRSAIIFGAATRHPTRPK